MYCKYCGNAIADGSRFCQHCGKSVTATAYQQTKAPSRSKSVKVWLIAIGALLVVSLLAVIILSNTNEKRIIGSWRNSERGSIWSFYGNYADTNYGIPLAYTINNDILVISGGLSSADEFQIKFRGNDVMYLRSVYSDDEDDYTMWLRVGSNADKRDKELSAYSDMQTQELTQSEASPSVVAQLLPTETPQLTSDMTFEIALVTDVGNIDDESYSQGAWEGVKAYAEANDKTFNYYRPSEDSIEARTKAIKNAIDEGAKVVVCPGYLFNSTLFEIQDQFPDTMFLLLDGEPEAADYSAKSTSKNVHCIIYQEEQAGYFAGYAAVKDGCTKLGFLGGAAIPAVARYGYGYVQGANDAAKELGITDQVEIKYWYCDSFAPNDSIMTKMSRWYAEGTEVVFACGGGIYLSAVAAAQAADAKVIGVDVDQSSQSPLIMTSAIKMLSNSVQLALTALYDNNGTWCASEAGTTANLGAADDCVGLPTATESWRFKNFTIDEYNTVFNAVKTGIVTVSSSIDVVPAVDISVDYLN